MSTKNQVVLYGFAYGDRSGRIRWLFEELGIPYEDHFLSWDRQEQRSTEYLSINPMGRVPTVTFDGGVLYESAAICLTFADLYPAKGLAPAVGSPARAAYYQWISFASSTLEPIIEKIWRLNKDQGKDQSKSQNKIQLDAEAAFEELKAASIVLESALSGRNYLVGGEFSAADIMIGGLMNWGDALLKTSPVFKVYFDRLKARPACKRARIFD